MRQKTPEIMYEDADLIVCRKEAGVAVQTARAGRPDMVSLLKNYRAGKGEEPYIAPVHRLDQPVEGVMVFAKTKRAAARLSEQVREGLMGKEYLAVVCGIPEGASGELTDHLLQDKRTNTSSVAEEGTPGAKTARLSYEVVRADEERGLALVRIMLHTGRHHQIRVQFAHAGHPLYGDLKYGSAKPDQERFPVALCSCGICFAHPSSGKEMEFRIRPEGQGFASLME